MRSELAYLGMLCLTLFLYMTLALSSLAPNGVIGKMSTTHMAAQRNVFLRQLLEICGFQNASPLGLRIFLYVVLLLLVICYFWAVHIFLRRPRGLPSILSVWFVLNIILLIVPPLLSRDVFSYMFYGKIATAYGRNPYLVTPQRFSADPLFPLTSLYWKNTPVVYGPLFTLLSMLLMRLSGNQITLGVYLFKSTAALFNLACVLLIWYILGKYSPRRRAFGTMLYAWNPLLLIHSTGGAHNDVIMAALALAALALLMQGRRRFGFFLLCLSFMIKYITLILMAAYLVYLFRKRENIRGWLRDVCVLALIFLAVFAAFYAPFWQGLRTLSPILENLKLRNYNLPAGWLLAATGGLLGLVLRLNMRVAFSVASVLCSLFLNAVFLVAFAHFSRRCRSERDFPECWFLVTLAFILTRTYFLSWYLFWVFPFLCLRRWDGLSRFTLTAGTLTLYFADLMPYSA
ncbi:polyprenol phosphomannose-dependent alpha 1,6 mannosyltransferase MptB [Candidatus Solincola tengchongensis]|uniref:polyprenol phosphomannose-dependent alpha 1,6 mannosyltransferase MptB n=1 Tax=Candidatus Solincola tengchongensis TaxID=2900693 RepID=UPI00257F7BB9|nr:polyprenol phosphomannose-dependent alpha 1,6 mannosyltransferase MptB [Candidatus Solincola tengchongensis]